MLFIHGQYTHVIFNFKCPKRITPYCKTVEKISAATRRNPIKKGGAETPRKTVAFLYGVTPFCCGRLVMMVGV